MANSEIRKPTLRQFLSGASLVAFLFFAASASAHHISAVWHSAQQNSTQSANEVSGKVIAIAPDKSSISLETTDRNNPTMQFAIDENTRVTGRVSVGNMATVQYQSSNDGKLIALNISPKTQSQ